MKDTYKAGYSGSDSMREKAAKMLGMVEKGSLKVKESKSAVGKEKERPYKMGGAVEKSPPYTGAGRAVGKSMGSNREESNAERTHAPMKGEPSPGLGKKKGGEVKKAMGGKVTRLNIEKMSEVPKKCGGVTKRAMGGRVGGDVNGSGERMPADAMQEYPKKKGGEAKMAMGGVGKVRKGEATKSGMPAPQKRKGYEY